MHSPQSLYIINAFHLWLNLMTEIRDQLKCFLVRLLLSIPLNDDDVIEWWCHWMMMMSLNDDDVIITLRENKKVFTHSLIGRVQMEEHTYRTSLLSLDAESLKIHLMTSSAVDTYTHILSTNTLTHKHNHKQTNTQTQTQTNKHTNTNTNKQTQTQTQTQTHTNTHKHTPDVQEYTPSTR